MERMTVDDAKLDEGVTSPALHGEPFVSQFEATPGTVLTTSEDNLTVALGLRSLCLEALGRGNFFDEPRQSGQ